MSFDEKLRQSFDQFADQLRDEARRRLSSLSDELGDTCENERQALAKTAEENARRTLDQEVASRVATEVAAVEARLSDAVMLPPRPAVWKTVARLASEEGRSSRDAKRFREGTPDGLEEGRQAGLTEGREHAENVKASELERSQRLIEAIPRHRWREVAHRGARLAGEQRRPSRAARRHPPAPQRPVERLAIHRLRIARRENRRGRAGERRRCDCGSRADRFRRFRPTARPPTPRRHLPRCRPAARSPRCSCGHERADRRRALRADPGSGRFGSARITTNSSWPAIVELLALHAAALSQKRSRHSCRHGSRRTARRVLCRGRRRTRKIRSRAAQRYARLVISEIKLYHESAVVAGPGRNGT